MIESTAQVFERRRKRTHKGASDVLRGDVLLWVHNRTKRDWHCLSVNRQNLDDVAVCSTVNSLASPTFMRSLKNAFVAVWGLVRSLLLLLQGRHDPALGAAAPPRSRGSAAILLCVALSTFGKLCREGLIINDFQHFLKKIAVCGHSTVLLQVYRHYSGHFGVRAAQQASKNSPTPRAYK